MRSAKYINTNISADKNVIAAFEVPDFFEFYTERPFSFIKFKDIMASPTVNKVVLINDTLMARIEKERIKISIIKTFENYPNEVITLPFLQPAERPKTLDHYYLIQIDNLAGNYLVQ